MNLLTSRQENILNCVVETYIDTAHPVGSQSLRERYSARCSSATIRNEMGVLEDTGYLVQPHVSSGRIPTDRGYRYYVDYGLAAYHYPDDFFRGVQQHLVQVVRDRPEPAGFVEEASRLLSSLAREVSVMMVADDFQQSPAREGHYRLVLQGSTHIFEKPEFHDLAKVRVLFEIFDNKEKLSDCLWAEEAGEGVRVAIGEENHPEELHDCAVIARDYKVDEKPVGTMALIGPKRMNYARALPLIDRFAELMGQVTEEEMMN